ncbi:unnamed protein product [Caenorhabditis bovis]|uniref:Potassium channel domain-containing protein n=1 Tax=Caenorhabditis bovis TaxID=2654633 RepID=A0A8S1EW75_9PELO|nr:unnamed protein product [Caenorhabditis bovis]
MNIPERFKWVSTLFVHFSLIVGVAAYTVFGALSMQFLESPDRVRSQIKRSISNDESITKLSERSSQVFLGEELSQIDPEIHKCVESTILALFGRTNCDSYELEHLNIDIIDRCYMEVNLAVATKKQTKKIEEKLNNETEILPAEKWSMGNSVIFAFTVITTIGYGHIAPETFEGRLFCILYGVIGVPFTLLTIADLGMFFTHALRAVLKFVRNGIYKIRKCLAKREKKIIQSSRKPDVWVTGKGENMETAREPGEDEVVEEKQGEEEEEEEEEEKEKEEPRKTEESVILGITFACYLLAGAKILSVYEPEMDFFKALYFNFVTLTTIGLGDFVPKSFDYLFVTLVYIGIGLALTTMAIEIAADLLKQIHYAGRKMEDAANAVVWFGGKKMKMKNLVQYLGDQFNIPKEELANFDVTQFVDNAMKVEKGEIATLRKPPTPVVFRDRAFSYSNLRKSSELQYVDDSRVSKITDLTTVQETSRTIDTLTALVIGNRGAAGIPPLDLDNHYFDEMSPRSSFDEQYMRSRRKHQRS